MKLPNNLRDNREWVLIGPMGPKLPAFLNKIPKIAVDGGANFSEEYDLWIGDGDSVKEMIPSDKSILLPKDKDQSDLACAFKLLDSKGSYTLHLWGFHGGRRDHELFVLGECFRFLTDHQETMICIYGEDGKILYHLLGHGQWKFSYQGIFSVGTIYKTCLSLTGDCEYPIKKKSSLYPLSSLGLSNKASGVIRIDNDGPIFVYYPEGYP